MDLAAKIQGMASRPFVSLDDLSKDRSTKIRTIKSLDEKPQTGRLESGNRICMARN